MRRILFIVLLICTCLCASGQDYQYRYWFDNDANVTTGTSASSSWKMDLDVGALSSALHVLHLQVRHGSGSWSAPLSRMFVKMDIQENLTGMKCLYKVDNGERFIEAGRMDSNAFHFDLPMDDISEGIHCLTYMLVDEKGVCSNIMSRYFVKVPDGSNKIVSYDYWTNDSTDNVRSVRLETPADPYSLIDMLQTDKCELRTKDYHFGMLNDVPMVYPVNELNIVFHDAQDRIVLASKSFADMSDGRAVEDIAELAVVNAKSTEKFDKPVENTFKWFAVNATTNDSIALKVSDKCYMEVYSPSGEKIFYADESNVRTMRGFTAKENGMYYIAVHDANTTSTSLTLTYLHEVTPFKVIYLVDGEEYKVYDVFFGDVVPVEEEPTKEGYTFSGWSEIPETMPAENVTVVGTFSVIDGIDDVNADTRGDVYNLQGVKVASNVALKDLNKEVSEGIYIIKGKKCLVK